MSRLLKRFLWMTLTPLVVMTLLIFGLTSLLLGNFAREESYSRLESEANIVLEAIQEGRPIPRDIASVVFESGEVVLMNRGGGIRRNSMMSDIDSLTSLSERDKLVISDRTWLTYRLTDGTIDVFTFTDAPFANPRFLQIYLILGIGFLVALVTGGIVSYLASRKLTTPLLELVNVTKEVVARKPNLTLPPAEPNEVGDLTRSIGEMYEVLKEQEQQQKMFISGVTHDIRTPLAIIRNEAELLGMGISPAEEVSTSVMEEIDRLDDLINQMISYSKASLTLHPLQMEQVNVVALLETLSGRLRSLLRSRKIELQIEAEPTTLETDRLLFERVILNFVTNAFHASPDGGRITITLKDRRLSIQDEGPGMPESLRKNIWNLYVKGDRSSGHGLGLATNKLLLEQLGMTYGLDTEPHTCFWIAWGGDEV